MNAIFTIITKNYLPLAEALMNSALKYNQTPTDYYIFIADEIDDLISLHKGAFKVIQCKDVVRNESLWFEMAFKYSLVEFCTCLKPFCFEFLFNTKYEKIIYFDPDIYFFNNLNPIWESLDNHSISLTPHALNIDFENNGVRPDKDYLNFGIFNLGFAAFKNSMKIRPFISWWKERLINLCYNHQIEGLFTDQKWMNLAPVYFDDCCIFKHKGCNVAPWNFHERKIIFRANVFYVTDYIDETKEDELIFVHFSGFDYTNILGNHRYELNINPVFLEDKIQLLTLYADELLNYKINQYINLPYSYGSFDNKIPIHSFYRRTFRAFLDKKLMDFNNPFESKSKDSFYNLLQRNGLIVKEQNIDKVHKGNFENIDDKIKYIMLFLHFLKFLLGAKRFILLMKFFNQNTNPERLSLWLIKR